MCLTDDDVQTYMEPRGEQTRITHGVDLVYVEVNQGMDQADGFWTNKLFYDTGVGGRPQITDYNRMDLAVGEERNVTHGWGANSVRHSFHVIRLQGCRAVQQQKF